VYITRIQIFNHQYLVTC